MTFGSRPNPSSNTRRVSAAVSFTRHLHVHDREVGLLGARERDRLLAVARLGADVEAGAPEHLGEVETDDRLVLGDQNLHCAMLALRSRMPLKSSVDAITRCQSAGRSSSTASSMFAFAWRSTRSPSSTRSRGLTVEDEIQKRSQRWNVS